MTELEIVKWIICIFVIVVLIIPTIITMIKW